MPNRPFHDAARFAAATAAAALLCVASACTQLPIGGMSESPPPDGTIHTLAQIEADIFAGVNRHRASIGLPPLASDPVLATLAREHSQNMATGAVPFGHDGFDRRFEVARQSRAISRISENVATNYNFPMPAVSTRVVTGWIQSRGHRENLEGSFQTTGVGVARSSGGEYYATQIYAAR